MAIKGFKDFEEPDSIQLSDPRDGFLGYLLRTSCSADEDLSGNYIFVENGKDCLKKYPFSKAKRANIRKEWGTHFGQYKNSFIGMIFYIKEEKMQEFVDFMANGSEEEIGRLLHGLTANLRSFIPATGPKIEPLYAVSHITQIRDGALQRSHLHIIWGYKKK